MISLLLDNHQSLVSVLGSKIALSGPDRCGIFPGCFNPHRIPLDFLSHQNFTLILFYRFTQISGLKIHLQNFDEFPTHLSPIFTRREYYNLLKGHRSLKCDTVKFYANGINFQSNSLINFLGKAICSRATFGFKKLDFEK